ncbi:tyrosine-protein phosphatase non-receptor type 9-like isoform X2 [Varroa destructor]|uniref:Tyrosine-protein phosphatase non-receptor type 9 n=1 Tax=Varroa destructor TaxID=109461 RepID=A0A7M7KTW4_VARDE|nr:tyrosine-protein phosphatase non-receptor type 9-like isoform X2 [Varroa destructor]
MKPSRESSTKKTGDCDDDYNEQQQHQQQQQQPELENQSPQRQTDQQQQQKVVLLQQLQQQSPTQHHQHQQRHRNENDQSPQQRENENLNSHEEEAVLAFQTRCPSVSRSAAVKFLAARKFSVDRAVELLRQHEAVRHREGLTAFQPTSSPLREELDTAKFTVLPWRDQQGAAITMFTAGRHSPSSSTHRTTLAGVVYQLDVALENPLTQRDGIVFVYNMAGSRYEHFDYELCQKILQLLKGAYPARLKKVLIVGAPLWFRAPFKILRLFVREKLRDRVMIVSQAQLVQHIPSSSLPLELGGTQPPHDHHAWLLHCLKVHNQQLSTVRLRQLSSSLMLLQLEDKQDLIDLDHAVEDDTADQRTGDKNDSTSFMDENNCLASKRDKQGQAGNSDSCDELLGAVNAVRSNRLSTIGDLHNSKNTSKPIAGGENCYQQQPTMQNGQAELRRSVVTIESNRQQSNGNDDSTKVGTDQKTEPHSQNYTVTPEREEAPEEEGDDSSLVSANSTVTVTGSTSGCWPMGAPPEIPLPPVPPVGTDGVSVGGGTCATSVVSGVPHVQHVPAGIVPPPPSAQAQTPPALEPSRDLSMEDFILNLQKKGRKGLCREYAEIKSRPPAGTFEAARDKMNQCKNRYTDVLCLDHSRVRLPVVCRESAVQGGEGEAGETDEDMIHSAALMGSTDYINANFVDGYAGSRAFISTQGPLPRTFGDFWKMVWEEKCGVIVMTTRCVERSRTKCGQYWPAAEGEEHEHGQFRIANQGVEAAGDYQVSELQLRLRDSSEDGDDTDSGAMTRTVWHLQFLSWPDYGVPESAFAMLSFRDVCLQKQRDTIRDLENHSLWSSSLAPQGPPIVVHCSAGIGRTGTFITLDTCIRRLESESRINVRGTVEAIRAQRAFSIQMPDQYVFCHLALLEYALIHGHLKDVDLSGFDDSTDESADEQH